MKDFVLQWPIRKKDPEPTEEEVRQAEKAFVEEWFDRNPETLHEMLRGRLITSPQMLDANLYGYHFAVITSSFFEEPVLLVPPDQWRQFDSFCKRRFGQGAEEAWPARGLPKIASRKEE